MRTRTATRTLVGLALALLTVAPAFAATPKAIGTITFVGWDGLTDLPIVGFQWNTRLPLANGGGGTGGAKPVFDPVVVSKLIDSTAPRLLNLTLQGATVGIVQITISLRRGATATYVLSEVTVIGNERQVAEGGGAPLQRLSLTARAVRETVTTAGGSVTTCWDLAAVNFCS